MMPSPADHPKARVAWQVLRALLAGETLLMLWVVGVSVVGALRSDGDAMQNLSIVVMAAISMVWVLVTFAGAAKSRASWVRGSSLTIHVLLFAGGTGCLQIGIGPWWLGWLLVAVALAGFVAAILARPEVQAIPE